MKIRYFDFGLHKGEELKHMNSFLQTVTSDYECYGFEACKKYADNCKSTITGQNIKILHLAITDTHNSNINLYYSPNGVGHSIHSSKNNININKYETVNTILFSKWLEENDIDLKDSFNIIKINIEGAEWELFNDVVNTDINKYIDIWCGAGHDVEKISKFIKNGTVDKYYKLIKENNINILKWCLSWHLERNTDIPGIIQEKYKLKNK